MQKSLGRIITLYLSTLMVLMGSLFLVSLSVSGGTEETLAYKLALLYTRHLNPEEALVNPSLAPERATLAEFQWLLDSLKNRCLDSENTIANTTIQTWQYLRKRGHKLTLLDILRSLNKFSQDMPLFGSGKVSFRAVANRWILENKLNK